MKINIIADDLTGASDSGVQLTKYGLKTTVVYNQNKCSYDDKDVIIFDTDSRSLSADKAYCRVKEIAKQINRQHSNVVYKKIDSTMRGNIGQEINAIYDEMEPDFVIIAPGYPANERKTINGYHYVDNKLLHETEVAKDPKTPVATSYIPEIIEKQSQRKTALISREQLSKGANYISEQLKTLKENGIHYIVFDAINKTDLQQIVDNVSRTNHSIVWCGSAGLIQHIPCYYDLKKNDVKESTIDKGKQVLLVVGSVSKNGRTQLKHVLQDTNVRGLEVQTSKVVQNAEKCGEELKRLQNVARAHLRNGYHLVLYSSSEINKTLAIGRQHGLNAIDVSNVISEFLGELASYIIRKHKLERAFLTGGDTANQVFRQLDAVEFILIDEVEPGIPLGRLYCNREVYVVTKAGNFGTEHAMLKSIKKLEGE